MLEQWSYVGQPCIGATEMDAANTFQAQGTFVLPVPGQQGRFIFMADQWDAEDLGASRCAFVSFFIRRTIHAILP
jgi:hypothetical protein